MLQKQSSKVSLAVKTIARTTVTMSGLVRSINHAKLEVPIAIFIHLLGHQQHEMYQVMLNV